MTESSCREWFNGREADGKSSSIRAIPPLIHARSIDFPLSVVESRKQEIDREFVNREQRIGQRVADIVLKQSPLPLTPPLSPPKDTGLITRSSFPMDRQKTDKLTPMTKIFFPGKDSSPAQGCSRAEIYIMHESQCHPIEASEVSNNSLQRPCMPKLETYETDSDKLEQSYHQYKSKCCSEVLSMERDETECDCTNLATNVCCLEESSSIYTETELTNRHMTPRKKISESDCTHSSKNCSIPTTSQSLRRNQKRPGKPKITTGKFAKLVNHDDFPLEKPINLGIPRATMLALNEFSSADSNFSACGSLFSDDTVVCRVNGLLNLPGSAETRYDITAGELRRRITEPEYLNKVDMISYVRLAKSSARDLLERYDIRPKHHSRRSRHSVLSKMCEGECNSLALGIQQLNEQYFPMEWLSNKAVLKIVGREKSDPKPFLASSITSLKTTRSTLTNLGALIFELKQERQLTLFDQATHTFGIQNFLNFLNFLDKCLESQQGVLQTYSSIIN